MTIEQKKIFRSALLQIFAANVTRFGLGIRAIVTNLEAFGFPKASEDDVEEAIRYWESNETPCLEKLKASNTPADRRWRITKAGIDWVEENT